jgi:hypothetical protein
MKQEIEQIKTADLVPYARNAKKHDEAQVAKLAGSIREFGFNNPVLIDADNGIIAGHGRVMAAQKLGLASVPCLRLSHLSETQKRAYILADNRLAELGGGWDAEMLKLELADLGDLDVDLDGIGFGADDLQDLELSEEPEASEVDAEPQIDKAEELRAKWGVEPGQLWELGDHRILCGDSTKAEDVERVMGGERADLCLTDPPYGISVVKSGMVGADFGVAKKGKYAPVIGDEKPPDISHLLSIAEKHIIWGGNYFADQLAVTGCWLIWDKRGDTGIENTFADCEIAWSNIGGPARIYRQLWNGMIREGERGQRQHPTQKPVSLCVWCINKAEALVVIDCYLGSGTTIIACEQLGRKCRAIEISPAYVAVAIQRWADATGKTPKLMA